MGQRIEIPTSVSPLAVGVAVTGATDNSLPYVDQNGNLQTSPTPIPLKRYQGAPFLKGALACSGLTVDPISGLGVTATSGGTSMTSRVAFTAPANTGIADLRLYYGNVTVTGAGSTADIVLGNSGTWKAAIEYNGTFWQVTFGGLQTASPAAGGFATSDPVGVEIPAGATFYVRTFFTGSNFPNGYQASSATDSYVATTDSSYTTGALGSAATTLQQLPVPWAVTCIPSANTNREVLVSGDSIASGFNDNIANGGYIRRGLANNSHIVHISQAKYGARLDAFVPGSSLHQYRILMAAGRDYCVEEWGINDINAGDTLATVQADIITLWGMLAQRGIGSIFSCTMCPVTTSTDSWATLPNQTVRATESVRVAFNTWKLGGCPMIGGAAVAVGTTGAITCPVYGNTGQLILAGSGTGHPCAGVFDPTSIVESNLSGSTLGNGGGLWVLGYMNAAGLGVHPSPTGYAAAAACIASTLFV